MLGFFKKKKSVIINSPVNGTAVDITNVPDEVFATKMVGDGIAFEPSEGELYSPVDGEIVNLFPTKHALGIRTGEGLEILIHIGIDTVELKGEGFESYIRENQTVKAGEKIMCFNIDLIKRKSYSTLILVIITNMDMVESIQCSYGKVSVGGNAIEVKLR